MPAQELNAGESPAYRTEVLARGEQTLRISAHEPARLTYEQLKERAARSPHIVNELYDVAQKQILAETGRQGRLDAKATSLLGAVGLSLTVAFTFGGSLITNHSTFAAHSLVYAVISTCFFLAVALGIAAGGFALGALLVRQGYVALSEQAVFDDETLALADGQEDAEVGVAVYKRFLLVQLWDIARTNAATQDRKAVLIRRGQVVFGVFLLCLVVMCLAESVVMHAG